MFALLFDAPTNTLTVWPVDLTELQRVTSDARAGVVVITPRASIEGGAGTEVAFPYDSLVAQLRSGTEPLPLTVRLPAAAVHTIEIAVLGEYGWRQIASAELDSSLYPADLQQTSTAPYEIVSFETRAIQGGRQRSITVTEPSRSPFARPPGGADTVTHFAFAVPRLAERRIGPAIQTAPTRGQQFSATAYLTHGGGEAHGMASSDVASGAETRLLRAAPDQRPHAPVVKMRIGASRKEAEEAAEWIRAFHWRRNLDLVLRRAKVATGHHNERARVGRRLDLDHIWAHAAHGIAKSEADGLSVRRPLVDEVAGAVYLVCDFDAAAPGDLVGFIVGDTPGGTDIALVTPEQGAAARTKSGEAVWRFDGDRLIAAGELSAQGAAAPAWAELKARFAGIQRDLGSVPARSQHTAAREAYLAPGFQGSDPEFQRLVGSSTSDILVSAYAAHESVAGSAALPPPDAMRTFPEAVAAAATFYGLRAARRFPPEATIAGGSEEPVILRLLRATGAPAHVIAYAAALAPLEQAAYWAYWVQDVSERTGQADPANPADAPASVLARLGLMPDARGLAMRRLRAVIDTLTSLDAERAGYLEQLAVGDATLQALAKDLAARVGSAVPLGGRHALSTADRLVGLLDAEAETWRSRVKDLELWLRDLMTQLGGDDGGRAARGGNTPADPRDPIGSALASIAEHLPNFEQMPEPDRRRLVQRCLHLREDARAIAIDDPVARKALGGIAVQLADCADVIRTLPPLVAAVLGEFRKETGIASPLPIGPLAFESAAVIIRSADMAGGPFKAAVDNGRTRLAECLARARDAGIASTGSSAILRRQLLSATQQCDVSIPIAAVLMARRQDELRLETAKRTLSQSLGKGELRPEITALIRDIAKQASAGPRGWPLQAIAIANLMRHLGDAPMPNHAGG